MKETEQAIPPLELYCQRCGHRMDVLEVHRYRMVWPWWEWQARVRCPRCSLRNQLYWGPITDAPVSRNRLMGMLLLVAHLGGLLLRYAVHLSGPRRSPHEAMASTRYLRPRSGLPGAMARHLAAVSFPVAGLRGHPLGLRLRRPRWGRPGGRRISLHYVAGDPRAPTRVLHLHQDRAPEGGMPPSEALGDAEAIHELIRDGSPTRADRPLVHLEEVIRDWSGERVRQAPRRQVIVTIEGSPVRVQLASWEEPRQVNVARTVLGGRQVLAASLGMSAEELLRVLESLTTLQRDPESVAEHQRDLEAVAAELRSGGATPASRL